MSSSKDTFSTLPAEIHTIIFSLIEADYQEAGKICGWKSDPLPAEIKQLAFINRQWRRLVIGRKFKFQHLRGIQDVRELANLTASHPVAAASLRDLTIFVAHTDLPGVWRQILKWAEEGARLQNLVVKMWYGEQPSQIQVAGTEGVGGKYTLYEFAADSGDAQASFNVPVAVEQLELNTSITDSASDQVLQLGDRSMDIFLSMLKTTTALRLNNAGASCRSRKFLRTMYEATCGYMESIIKLHSQNMANLTTLELTYNVSMSREPYNTSTRSFYLDKKIDERGDNLSNLLRHLSKKLKSVLIRYNRATSEIFEPKDGILSDGEPEDWPHLHTFRLIFSDMDAYGYRRSELESGASQNVEDSDSDSGEEEPEPMDNQPSYQDIPKNDNDGFDWLNPNIIDDNIKYKNDREDRTATSEVRSFYLTAAKAVANKMRAIRSFKMTMNLSFDSQVYMEYANQSPDLKLVVIGHQILEPNEVPKNEDEEVDTELVRIFKEGVGKDVKIKFNLPTLDLVCSIFGPDEDA
ncbi:hypothetical protein TWF694_004996 [Orbilia ellipsospora]|uniref:F-box domain-containing protein n=1 Tax=Orbilia ellipsospora TaxID=2528407 RepID=A0AAV9WUA3_9PEZI